MKKFLLFLTGFLFCYAFAVKGQPGSGVVYYDDIESIGAPGANLRTFNAALYFSPEKSAYVTRVDSLENGGKRIAKTYTDENGDLKGVQSNSTEKGLFNITNRRERTMVSNARFKSNFTYREEQPRIDWKISSEKRKIGGLEVIKATATFRGRHYTAWYAPDIAVPLGPWKLHGLPGLILEAYDDNREIQFVFKKLEYPYRGNMRFPALPEQLPGLADLRKEQDGNYERNMKYQRALAEQYSGSVSSQGKTAEYRKRYLELFD
ncbi:GLPGLI family protein [Pontibacter lucknowensis]|uniref:GLPGLI family protein n=1 Tax=Pontibacter lucknowensis TaxID=1077936 RepID=A0A1N6Y1F7_9BACT|nr:GLPGLI family protein [Pontibacter lucknowensis]SIR08341.1 GLPGLI family protein [Pontibacter lucknowensis]